MATMEARLTARRAIGLEMTLTRRKGGPITGWTLDVGGGGLRVATDRPLGIDEILHFELPLDAEHSVAGNCRVVREHAPNVYGLRFVDLPDDAAREVSVFVANAA